MNWISLPVAAMAAISLYVGAYHLILFIRKAGERENLTFALCCMSVSAYNIISVGLYNANSLEEGVLWQRWQYTIICLMAIAFAWFIFDFLMFL